MEYIILAFIAVTGTLIALLLKRKSRKKAETVDYSATVVDVGTPVYTATIVDQGRLNYCATIVDPGRKDPSATIDPEIEAAKRVKNRSQFRESKPLAALLILNSDDKRLVNKQIPIPSTPFKLGRIKDNEAAFPKDYPVSRDHAVIDTHDNNFYISEASYMKNGALTLPAFGTFVNDIKVEQEPVQLHHGDEIRLGMRLRIRFLIEA